MDIVWLKRDVRLTDHGPLSYILRDNHNIQHAHEHANPLLILYCYEPDQLSEPTVHGSHVAFCNEGLVDFDRRLSDDDDRKLDEKQQDVYKYTFQCLTVCHAGVVHTFQQILNQYPIRQILAHEETGNLRSFARDKAVRRWCKNKNIPIIEFNQTGVTRCLKSRDNFSTKFNDFITQPLCTTPNNEDRRQIRQRLVRNLKLYKQCFEPIPLSKFTEIQEEFRVDREERQMGGETIALSLIDSFLNTRGRLYSSSISSPNTSWTHCSRISPYITWGHISTRYIFHKLHARLEELRSKKKRGNSTPNDIDFTRSLTSFCSRMHWRSHFIQKLESEPEIEKQDMCRSPLYQVLRREDGDWNEAYFQAWKTGNTGFPFVDACMRCLLKHGWINFRMRAMLVSFATYNLWLDWKRLTAHLARMFLDYEPGIHYPQIQMQAGTTGINEMRVYSVTKQGKDQDPDGVFIRKYVEELRDIPTQYIHQPHTMSRADQVKYKLCIGKMQKSVFITQTNTRISRHYPSPIVDEKLSAKIAKDKLNSVRKQKVSREAAIAVYEKHGSRVNKKRNKEMISRAANENPPEDLPPKTNKKKTLQAGIQSLLLSSQSSVSRTVGWHCKVCTFFNKKSLALCCEMCSSLRETTEKGLVSRSYQRNIDNNIS